MDEASPRWSTLSGEAREAFEWAAACEERSPDIGTRAVLIGILRTQTRGTAAHDLLQYLSLSESRLFDALRRGSGGYKIDPAVKRKIPLDDFPPLTGNSRTSLGRAYTLCRESGRTQIDLDCMFGGLLQTNGTARKAILKFIDVTLLDRIDDGYLNWLRDDSVSFRDFLELTLEVKSQDTPSDASLEIAESAVEEAPSPSMIIANVRNDADRPPDLIGVGDDARALAALIASRQLAPPLALGLYGPWGSGKTFFMRELEENVKQLARSSSDSNSYCSRIGHVWFNAWHYAEANLWASLLDHVFTNLHGEQNAYQLAVTKAIETLSGARQLTEAAEASAAAATKRVDVAQRALDAAIGRRAEALKSAAEIKVKDIWRTVAVTAEDQGLVNDVKEAAAQLGLPALGDSAGDLYQQTLEIRGLSQRAAILATSGKKWRSPLAVAIYALIIVGAATWAISALIGSSDTWSATVALLTGQLAAIASAVAAWMSRGGSILRRVLAPAETLQARLETRKNTVQASFEAELARCAEEIRAADAEKLAAQEALRVAQSEELATKAEQARLTGTRLLRRYLKERVDSEDYRQHLGVVALARRDLDDLQAFMHAALEDAAGEGRLERIILFIDDLDRCEPERVADVLDAIHLLLAMPLFVVVVGVNPDWLARALEKRHPVLLRDASSRPRSTTADDYLEKIFQLTYSLRPLGAGNGARFVTGLARTMSYVPEGTLPGAAQAGKTSLEGPDAVTERTSKSASIGSLAEQGGNSLEVPSPEMLSQALTLNRRDIELLAAVAPLVSTSPRRAQRFLNLYMVLRARYRPGPDDFDEDALVLTAALAVGMPASFAEVLNAEHTRADGDQQVSVALKSAIKSGSDEEHRWREYHLHSNVDVERMNGMMISRLRAWLDRLLPYLPLTFQSMLKRADPHRAWLAESSAGSHPVNANGQPNHVRGNQRSENRAPQRERS